MKKDYEERVQADKIERDKLIKAQQELPKKSVITRKLSEEVVEFNSLSSPQLPKRKLEFVVEIQMKEKGSQEIRVFEGDTAEDLAQSFCTAHQVKESKKQQKLLQLIETRMAEHYGESLKELQEVEAFLKESWQEFNPKGGAIDLPTYLELMKFCAS